MSYIKVYQKKIYNQVHKIKNLKGRLELVKELPNRSKVFIDYAHTPDAIETVINFDQKLQIKRNNCFRMWRRKR